ncbi:hypothetical protein FF38_13586 [Lucilia cuprina]|uniref:PHD-type domain-containing protein n=1 Tax=Lucilia cuprina TaxID=7375 RepID=A0A0L0BTC7_LUCCU|nr:hypothetical protein FF38_13586 [Lucilia cuprina]
MAKNMAENITLAANCILCSDPDDGNMITCSKCLHCFHSSCCDINDDVDIFKWKCQDCVAAIPQQDDSPDEADKCQQIDNVRPVCKSNKNATIDDPPCVQCCQQNINISRLQESTSLNSSTFRRVANLSEDHLLVK